MMKVTTLRKLLKLPLLVLFPVFTTNAPAQQKDGKAITSSACAHEYASDRSDHTAFMYRDHDKTTEHETLYMIVETPDGNLKRKLEDHGQPLRDQQRSAEDARLQAIVNDP